VRILFLTPDVPLPADQGAKLRTIGLIRAAARFHQVDVLSFARSDEAAGSGAAELADLCHEVHVVDAPPPRPTVRRAFGFLFEPLPDLAHRLESPEYRSALWERLDRRSYHAIQIEGLEMMPYLATARSAGKRAHVIYDAHNAEMSLQRTMFQAELRNPRRLHGALYSVGQWSKLGTYERVMMNETDAVITVSAADAAKLRGRHVEPEIIPNGVDTAEVPFSWPRARRDTLLFVGPMDYRPNADAAGWLVNRVLPAIRQARPEARLRLVGRGAERFHGEGVEAVGYVDDIQSEIDGADVMVAPLRMGGGTRFKVLQAMAAGLPVVTTPLGLQGIEAEPGRGALVAASAADFAAAVTRVLDDPAFAERLARTARKLVESRYDWSVIAPKYLALLSKVRRQR
jgi:glycosyltransferase involved in cell wall biosynthesis